MSLRWAHTHFVGFVMSKADLSLRWAHTHFVGFVMLICSRTSCSISGDVQEYKNKQMGDLLSVWYWPQVSVVAGTMCRETSRGVLKLWVL